MHYSLAGVAQTNKFCKYSDKIPGSGEAFCRLHYPSIVKAWFQSTWIQTSLVTIFRILISPEKIAENFLLFYETHLYSIHCSNTRKRKKMKVPFIMVITSTCIVLPRMPTHSAKHLSPMLCICTVGIAFTKKIELLNPYAIQLCGFMYFVRLSNFHEKLINNFA